MKPNIWDKFIIFIYEQTKNKDVKNAITKLDLELLIDPKKLRKLKREFEEIITEEEVKELAENFDEEFKDFQYEILELLNSKEKEDKGVATEKIVKRIKLNNAIFTTRNDIKTEMWIYRSGIYVPHGRTYVKEYCRSITKKAFTPQLANQVISKIETDTYIDEQTFFNNNIVEEIPVKNGILNIHTKRLSKFTPEKVFFSKIPVEFDPKMDCPKIKQFFKDILKDESDIDLIQELFGTLLEKDYRLEKAFMFLGTGRNGKGKTVELIKRFLGIENCCSVPLQELQNDSFRLSELHNKLVNVGSDISSKALQETGSFKELTGRDMISAKRKFLSDIHFTSFAKQIFCANELPTTYDLTPAFFSRWVPMDFPYTFKTQEEIDKSKDKTNLKVIDPEVVDKIATSFELSGLLNWALEGLKRTIESKNFSHSKTADEVKNIWIRKSDSFSGFIMDCLEYDWDNYITKKELRIAYSKYCRHYKLKPSSDKKIKVLLSLEGIGEDREMVNDQREYVWSGVKFRIGQGGQDGRGFYPYSENIHFSYKGKNIWQSSHPNHLEKDFLKIKEEKVE